MAEDLAALKVKIGIRPNGQADHPDFNVLPIVKSSGMDWSKWIDVYGRGWQYDITGHKEETADSPVGQQWALLLVPEAFAQQAVAQYPTKCARQTADEAESFYNTKVSSRYPDEDIDEQVLDQIQKKQALGVPLTPEQKRALDPRDPTRGIRPHKLKRFSGFKKDRGFHVVDPSP